MGGRLVCVLDWGRSYDLMSAYPREPHIECLSLKDDEDLARFVRRWGPLWLVYRDLRDQSSAEPEGAGRRTGCFVAG